MHGLIDRTNHTWHLIDFDPTHMASLQAPAVEDPERPSVRRPRAASTAPGYAGRKRADEIRTRSAVLLTHVGMWLTGIAQPGNGHRAVFLNHACTQIVQWCARMDVALTSVLVRADGEFGSLAQIAQIAGHNLGWLVRAKDYVTLLQHPKVREVLSRGSPQRMTQPDSPIVRELFDVPNLLWRSRDGRHEVCTRLVVTRTPWPQAWGKPSVGHLHDGFVYELFVTHLPPESASAADVVSLYLGRGTLEATLGQEDREMTTDRWITHRAHGQDLFQIFSQWVWNHRVALGAVLLPYSGLRETPWDVSVAVLEPTPISSLPDGHSAPSPQVPETPNEPMPSTSKDPNVSVQPVSESSDEPTPNPPDATNVPTPKDPEAPSSKLFGVEKFVRNEQGQVHCPHGVQLQRIELRRRRCGDRERYRAPYTACRDCPMVSQCCRNPGALLQGRTVDLPVVSHATPAVPIAAPVVPPVVSPATQLPVQEPLAAEQPLCAPPQSCAPPPASPRPPYHLPVVGVRERMLWTDLAACEMRRTFVARLWSEHVEIERMPLPSVQPTRTVTRSQRAHRRATWTERIERNQLPPTAALVNLKIYGIPVELALRVGLRDTAPSSSMKTSSAHAEVG
jgi:hypothetical protein